MTDSLTAKVCTPCQGGIPPLSPTEAGVFHHLTDDSTWIRRSFGFDNFVGALDFVNKVGALAEEQGHHPDIKLGWGYVDVSFQTHKIKGLHENDFILAAKIDAMA